MRRIPFPSIAQAIGLTVVAALALAAVATRPAIAQQPPLPLATSTCAVWPRVDPMDVAVPLGASMRFRFDLDLTGCPALPATTTASIIFAVDGSGSMAHGTGEAIRAVLVDVVWRLDLANHPTWRVGIVAFADDARALCNLTTSLPEVAACLARVGARGETCTGCGLDAARAMLARARVDGAPSREVIVVGTDVGSLRCPPSDAAAAAAAAAEGIEIAVACIGPHCRDECVADLASGPDFVFDASHPSESPSLTPRIADMLLDTTGTDVEIDVRALDGMTFAVVAPLPVPVDVDMRRWRRRSVGAHGSWFAVTVRPQHVGASQLAVEASGRLTDALGATAAFTFPVPIVDVVGPTPAPPSTCPHAGVAPTWVIEAALADPTRIGGWGLGCRSDEPVGPLNPLRRWLDLRNANLPWHPVFNGVVFKCGCG